ncbi:MAG TPA: hypothetical protein VLA04_02230, partial [Verrucomicrobiae bacterium]|nr:hypothetical protein [Verrucomicrobiae bacterium]
KDGGADSGWAIDTTNAATGYLYLLNTTGSAVTQNDFVIVLSTITNPSSTVSGGNECDAVANSDTCYIRIETHTEDTVAEIDSATYREDTGVTTFTVVTPVTVTATVDPSLTFTVAAVTSGNLSTNDSNASCANPVTSTSTTLPFGNLGIGIAANRCSQHSLAVATNAPSGYDVYFKFVGTNPLTGTIGSNNIDVFANSSATFGSPQLFNVDPTGTSANVNSGWIGLRSTDIGGFGSNLYAPPAVNNSSTVGDSVMTSSGPDLGTGSNIKYVTLKIAVNALQPADTYTGTAQYNVVARY